MESSHRHAEMFTANSKHSSTVTQSSSNTQRLCGTVITNVDAVIIEVAAAVMTIVIIIITIKTRAASESGFTRSRKRVTVLQLVTGVAVVAVRRLGAVSCSVDEFTRRIKTQARKKTFTKNKQHSNKAQLPQERRTAAERLAAGIL